MKLCEVKKGDKVLRLLSESEIPMHLTVTDVTEERIICHQWEFCRKTGWEIDEFLMWGPDFGGTGSYLKLEGGV